MTSVLVLGGGVSGLTSALQLARAGYDVEIWQAARGMAPPNWLWEYPPYHVEPADKACEWARVSLKEFTRLSKKPECHVHIVPVILLGREKLPENPGMDFLPHFKQGQEALAEAGRYLWSEGDQPKHTYVDAQIYHGPVCNSAKYLVWLQEQINAFGGRIKKQTVSSLEEVFARRSADVVVNCSGMGAKEISRDADVYPCRGELLHVSAPWIQVALSDDSDSGCYMIPCPGSDLELGGTADDDAYERKFSKDNMDHILKGNIDMVPSLHKAEVGDGWVGLRPSRRSGVRLELEWHTDRELRKVAVIHNYGHSGSGMCCSYGCADEVVKLVNQAINSIKSRPKF